MPAHLAGSFTAIPGARALSDGSGMWSVPCVGIPEISLTFGGKHFAISHDTLIVGTIPGSPDECLAGIVGEDDQDYWLVGDVFLQNVYSTFDIGMKRVGFADLV